MRLTRGGAADPATIYKLCSLALQYPDDELVAARAELAAIAARLPAGPASRSLQRFFDWFARTTPPELAGHYVRTFDLHKRSVLYLTFYSLGDRRDRGMALLRLRKLYRAAGLPQADAELPDFLPVMLEFAAFAAPGRGTTMLREHRPALELIRLSLHDQQSPYADALDAVCEQVGGMTPGERLGLEQLVAQGPPQELVGLEPFAPPEVMPEAGAMR